MRLLLRQHDFVLLWAAQIISRLGDWLLLIVLPFYVFQLTNSTLATGIMFIVETLPSLLLGSLAGVFVDRWERRKTMCVVSLLQGLLLFSVLLVRDASHIWIAYLFAFLNGCVALFFVPAQLALLPTIVREEDLMEANTLSFASDQVASIIGPAIAGFIMGLAGISTAIVIDILSFFLAVCCLFFIHEPARSRTRPVVRQADALPGAVQSGPRSTGAQLAQEWKEGLVLIYRSRLLLILACIWLIVMFAQGVLNVERVPFFVKDLGGSVIVFGWISAAQGIGSLLCSLFIKRLSQVVKPYLLISLSMISIGVLLAIGVNSRILWLYVLLICLIGFPVLIQFTTCLSLLQRATDNAYQGRLFGLVSALASLAMLLGMGVTSFVGDRAGDVAFMNISCLCFFICGLLAFGLRGSEPAPMSKGQPHSQEAASWTSKDSPASSEVLSGEPVAKEGVVNGKETRSTFLSS